MQRATQPTTEGGKADRTRKRIIDAAAHEFAQHGYGGTSLRNVANGAKLQLGSLYFHFASKNDLVSSALEEGVDFAHARVTSALAALPPDAPGHDRLRTAIRAHLEALHASHDRAAAVVRMVDTLPPELRHAQAVHERRYGRLWSELLTDAQREGAVPGDLHSRQLRDLLFGAMNNTVGPRETPPAVLTLIVEALTGMVTRTTQVERPSQQRAIAK